MGPACGAVLLGVISATNQYKRGPSGLPVSATSPHTCSWALALIKQLPVKCLISSFFTTNTNVLTVRFLSAWIITVTIKCIKNWPLLGWMFNNESWKWSSVSLKSASLLFSLSYKRGSMEYQNMRTDRSHSNNSFYPSLLYCCQIFDVRCAFTCFWYLCPVFFCLSGDVYFLVSQYPISFQVNSDGS